MQSLIERIHGSDRCGVLVVTGGGSLAVSELLTVPGASQTLLEALVPYSPSALADFLNVEPQYLGASSCCERTARAMAMTAFWRALHHAEREQSDPDSDPEAVERVWGVACTASLKSNRPKRGEHRLHLAVQTASVTETFSLRLAKEARTRAEEERVAADLILAAVATACGLELPFRADLLPQEQLEHRQVEAPEDWQHVVLGRADAVCAMEPEDAAWTEEGPSSGWIFPGAFHPLHQGHRGLAQWVERKMGGRVEFEISVENVDKLPLDYVEIGDRLAQFTAADTVWLTRAPTFVEKSRCFPGTTFLVGADTIERIADSKYYADEDACRAALDEIAERGCRFLVFGRVSGTRFVTLEDLNLPGSLRNICQAVPESEFREDVSSTEIRAQGEAQDGG